MSYVFTDANWIAVAKFLVVVNAANFLLGCYRDYLAYRIRQLTAKNAALRAKLPPEKKITDNVEVKITADNSDAMTKIAETTAAAEKLSAAMDGLLVRINQARAAQAEFRNGLN